MRPIVFVAVACHFYGENIICETTRVRLGAVLDAIRKCLAIVPNRRVRVVVTGDVSYHPDGIKLNQLMERYLLDEMRRRKISGNISVVLSGGVGVFSEARWLAAWMVRENITHSIVSICGSDWYLEAAKPVWRHMLNRFCAGVNFRLDFISVEGTGGERTRSFYRKYAFLIKTAHKMRFIGAFMVLETLMYLLQNGRKRGFIWNGCA